MKRNELQVESVAVDRLKPHPKNYRTHPPEQIAHLVGSIRAHGIYRNVVVARDNTILAGHGIVEAAKKAGLKTIPVRRLDVDAQDPVALNVLVGDNEIAHLSESDDRVLTDLLRKIKAEGVRNLLGTGFDEMRLAHLLYETRAEGEIKDFNEAAAMAGVPGYQKNGNPIQLIIYFDDKVARERLVRVAKLKKVEGKGKAWFAKWPQRGGIK
jgi:aryl carrier-like protein